MKELVRQVLIPTFDQVKKETKMFDSEIDQDDKLAEVVLSSCSAPTYFNENEYNGFTLADGGIACNNPTVELIHEAMRQGYQKEDIFVLSLGTGEMNDESHSDGLLHWAINGVDITISA